MDVIPYTRLRMHLAAEMDRVCRDHSPLIVTRRASASVVMMSLDDYETLEETAHLLRSPRNARRLLESILELEGGGGVERSLVGEDEGDRPPGHPGSDRPPGAASTLPAVVTVPGPRAGRYARRHGLSPCCTASVPH